MTTTPQRRVRALDDVNREFWTSGRENELRLRRCVSCRFWIHPPQPICPKCHRRELAWEATSGRATLYTYTVNHRAWNPDVPVPYLIGIVELPEQAGLRMTTNVVNCAVGDAQIGMALRVTFEQQGELFIPLFEPESGS
jgi:uncharacterized protein